jgi:hypothetical protein
VCSAKITLYLQNSFTNFSCKYIARLERVQEKFILYALRRLGWMDLNLLPPYESRCKLLNLDTLCRRREISSVMFVRDVLCARIDSSSLLGMLALTANPHRVLYY